MKIIAACLMALLLGSCRQANDRPRSEASRSAMATNTQLDRIMDDYEKADNPYYHKSEFEFRGPLTVAQVETELLEMYKEVLQGREDVPDLSVELVNADLGPDWREIKSAYRDGDALYFFTSDERSWAELRGERGYVLIRDNKVVGVLITDIN